MTATTLTVGQPTRLPLQVTAADKARSDYLMVPIAVPPGTTRIDVGLTYRKGSGRLIDLGILDPTATDYPTTGGFRGWSGGARDEVFVATDTATPGYIAGPIQSGVWQVLLGLVSIPADGIEATLTLSVDDGDRPPVPVIEHPPAVRPGAGWYKGDLHAHTFHSDARGGPDLLHRMAVDRGLDFLAITDHNTLTAWDAYFAGASSPDLVFIRGVELTTQRGHLNIFGLKDWIDFRIERDEHLDVLTEAVRSQGAILSINHDKPPLPWCLKLPAADCMEVWHQHWLAGNDSQLALWDTRLAGGTRLTLIGGSDYHMAGTLEPDHPFALGCPTTVIYLDELSEAGLIAGIRRGRGYVTEGPDGPSLDITAEGAHMGSRRPATDTLAVDVRATGAVGDRLVLVTDRGVVADMPIDEDRFETTLRVYGAKAFLRAEIRAEASHDRLIDAFRRWYGGRLPRGSDAASDDRPILRRALSNPIYLAPSYT